MPGWNPPEFENGTGSYGGNDGRRTHQPAVRGVDKNDPRVQAAYKWMTANYTLDVNPGTNAKHGLYYFYNAYAKVMAASARTSSRTQGQKHNWRNELAQKLVSLQAPDGSWSNKDSNKWWKTSATRHRLERDRPRARAQVRRLARPALLLLALCPLQRPGRRRASR